MNLTLELFKINLLCCITSSCLSLCVYLLYASQMCQNLTTGQSHLGMQNIIKIIWEVMTILHEGN